MAEAPDGNKTLTVDDAAGILEKIFDVKSKYFRFGVMLKLPYSVVDSIHSMNLSPEDCLLQILIAFLKQQGELKPTWGTIIEVLESEAIGEIALANKLRETVLHVADMSSTSKEMSKRTTEVAHLPAPAASHELISQTDGESSAKATAPEDEDEVRSKQLTSQLTPATSTSGKELCVSSTSKEIKERISELDDMFHQLKDNIRECLEKKGVLVKKVADVLTSISPDEDDQHKMFLEGHNAVLFQAANISELFGTMNIHWNYLNPPLLDHLVRKFKLEEVKGEMESYKSDLQHFRKQTPLAEFCRTQKRKRLRLTPEFREMVAEFDWPKDATLMLEVVEQFREEYASQYNLRDCAMMIAKIRSGSYIISWFIPESIVKVLMAKSARAVLKKFSVTRLDIDGVCVYGSRKPFENIPVANSGPVDGASFATNGTTKPKPAPGQATPLPEEDYLFVELPSVDFFCPVTMGLLLQPHLTSCCGNHLSQEAANRIQGERGACPLCNEKQWSTMLSKHYKRQVNSLHVFCRHEERGCGWQGELGTYQSHVESCPMAEGPLTMTELVKLPKLPASAPDGDETLTPDNARKILEELLDAMNHAKLLGLMLNIKPRDVEAILNKYKDPKEQLLHIIEAFLQQAELRPTWRAIIEALRSSVVGLTALANEIESNHFPDLTASREAGIATSAAPEDEVKSKQSTTPQLTPATSTSGKELCVSSTSEEIKEKISELKMMFNELKSYVGECLQKKQILVKKVADVLTSIGVDEDDQHKLFLQSHIRVLFRAADVPELFGMMSFHWNYLNPSLLDHLVRSFKLEEVKGEMESYKLDLRRFRKQTPLAEFCRTQKRRRLRLAPQFREIVVAFVWPKDATLTLEVVEQFRQAYASQYNLRDCAMMVEEILFGSQSS